MNPREFFKIQQVGSDLNYEGYYVLHLNIDANCKNALEKYIFEYLDSEFCLTDEKVLARVFTWSEAKKFLEDVDKSANLHF